MPKPIFLVGAPRTGTTWLANLLCNHSSIAGVMRETHFGIYESAFFSNIEGKYGDLQNDDNFDKFMEIFSMSKYFKFSKLEKNIFFKEKPKTYPDFFRLFMDNFAKIQRAEFWLEKTPAHALCLEKISKYYPDARFIAINRDVIDTIKSTVKLIYAGQWSGNNFPKLIIILRSLLQYITYNKNINIFSKKTKLIKIVQYENLKSSKKNVLNGICEFLNINFEHNMLNEKYKQNTSFKSKQDRKQILNFSDEMIIQMVFFISRFLPLRFFKVGQYIAHHHIFKEFLSRL